MNFILIFSNKINNLFNAVKFSELFSIFNFGGFQSRLFKREVESAFHSGKPVKLPPYEKITDENCDTLKSKFSFFPISVQELKSIGFDSELFKHNWDKIATDAQLIMENKIPVYNGSIFTYDSGIKWDIDFNSKYEFSKKFIWDEELLRTPKGVDPVIAWQIGNFHFITTLSLAYLKTGDEIYTRKFLEVLSDFNNENPFCVGIQWYDITTTSVRLINLCFAFSLFLSSPILDAAQINMVKELILLHAVYIENFIQTNKKNNHEHIISVLGLLSVALIVGGSSYGKRIKNFAHSSFERGIKEHIHNDGVCKVQSVNFHTLITECFLYGKILLQKTGVPTSRNYDELLHKAFIALSKYQRKDGSLPNFGDHIVTPIFSFADNINSDLLSIGSFIFRDRELKYLGYEPSIKMLLFFGKKFFDEWKSLKSIEPAVLSTGFTQGGHYILNKKDVHIFIRASEIGKNGSGAPAHNDTFSFELFYNDKLFVVDTGTYSFYADKEIRNQLRSVFSHNTFYIDNEPLSVLDGLFNIREDLTKPKLLEWKSNNEEDILSVQHYSYVRLPDPVICKRTFHFYKDKNKLKIKDEFVGGEKHAISGNLYLHPKVKVSKVYLNEYLLEYDSSKIQLIFHHSSEYFESSVLSSNYSPTYGVIIPSQKVHYVLSELLPAFYVIEWNLL